MLCDELVKRLYWMRQRVHCDKVNPRRRHRAMVLLAMPIMGCETRDRGVHHRRTLAKTIAHQVQPRRTQVLSVTEL